MRKRTPKPFSQMTRDEKVKEARAAIARLSHPHNYGSRECAAAIVRWRETLKQLGAEEQA